MATIAQREHARRVMLMLYRHSEQILYPQHDVRTSLDAASWRLTEAEAGRLLAQGGRMQFDCSEFCPWVLKCAGMWPWTLPGATASHVRTIFPQYTNARALRIGGLAVFGPGNGHHEAICYRPDTRYGNPLMMEHGSPGVHLTSLRDIAARQAAEGFPGVRLLAITRL
jgi:hypothetical protein